MTDYHEFQHGRLSHICTKKVIQYSLQNLVCGCIFRIGIGNLKWIQGKFKSQTYQTKIVNDIDLVGECLILLLCRFIIQYDNAHCHRSVSTLSFLTEWQIDILNWPANFHDANQIENLWHSIKIKMNDLEHFFMS